MSIWDNCPLELFDLYLEVRDVKPAAYRCDECVFVELWVASFFWAGKDNADIVRRPIYGICKQIRKICGSKPACVVIMSKEGDLDPVRWGPALWLLLNQLQKENALQYAMLYTVSTPAKVRELSTSKAWRQEQDAQRFQKLLETLDVIIYGQANYQTGHGLPQCQHPTLPAPLDNFFRFVAQE